MNLLSSITLGFRSSFFQQSDQQQSLRNSFSGPGRPSEYPVLGDTPSCNSLQNQENKTSPDICPLENSKYNELSKNPCENLNGCSKPSCAVFHVVNTSDGSVSESLEVDEVVKKPNTSKKVAGLFQQNDQDQSLKSRSSAVHQAHSPKTFSKWKKKSSACIRHPGQRSSDGLNELSSPSCLDVSDPCVPDVLISNSLNVNELVEKTAVDKDPAYLPRRIGLQQSLTSSTDGSPTPNVSRKSKLKASKNMILLEKKSLSTSNKLLAHTYPDSCVNTTDALDSDLLNNPNPIKPTATKGRKKKGNRSQTCSKDIIVQQTVEYATWTCLDPVDATKEFASKSLLPEDEQNTAALSLWSCMDESENSVNKMTATNNSSTSSIVPPEQNSSDSRDGLSAPSCCDLSCLNTSDGLGSSSLHIDEHIMQTSRKNKKKKGKRNKKSSSDIFIEGTAKGSEGTAELSTAQIPHNLVSQTREVSTKTLLSEKDHHSTTASLWPCMDETRNSSNFVANTEPTGAYLGASFYAEDFGTQAHAASVQCLSNKSKERSDTTTLQKTLSSCPKLDDSIIKGFADKQDKNTQTILAHSGIPHVSVREELHEALAEGRACSEILDEPFFSEVPVGQSTCILTGSCKHQNSGVYENGSGEINCKATRMMKDEISLDNSDMVIKGSAETLHVRSFSKELSSEATGNWKFPSTSHQTFEDGCVPGVKINHPHFSASEIHKTSAKEKVEHVMERFHCLRGASDTPACINSCKYYGKQRFVRQETQMNGAGIQSQRNRRFNPDHLLTNSGTQEAEYQLNHHSFSRKTGLRVGNFPIDVQRCKAVQGQVLVESSKGVIQQKFLSGHGHYTLVSKGGDKRRNKVWEPKGKMNQVPKNEAFRKEFWNRRYNFHGQQRKLCNPQRGLFGVPSTRYLQTIGISGCTGIHSDRCHLPELNRANILHEAQPWMSVEVPREDQVSIQVHPAVIDTGRSSCFEIESPHGKCIPQVTTSKIILQKQIPAEREHSLVLGTDEAVGESGMGKTNTKQGHSVFFGKTPHVLSTSIGLGFDANSSLNRGKYMVDGCKELVLSGFTANGTTLFISSNATLQALKLSYRLHVASEKFQLVTGSPIAEFERLLYSVSPVIIPSIVQKHCHACSRTQLTPSAFCKYQFPSVSLLDVWSWYEEPGNYGLDVEAEDSEYHEGIHSNIVPFHAYFVPSLSAVQLFGHSQSLSAESQKHSTSSKNRSQLGETQSNQFACSADTELVFEFFEHERPDQRKPLHVKIKELMRVGTMGNFFGDPSKLESLNLHDLHPASWYAVAWYPIYRIPEGSLRASFLTYHSLGHLTQRYIKTDQTEEAVSIVSPVIGLQSYNAQAECWFNPKRAAESCEKMDNSDTSAILKERLRTLEETAAVFARGCVYKAKEKATNKHPDYEFFLSRKR